MLIFPNCKINLGLNVTSKRPDGFHNIETVFYPVTWLDGLELLESGSGKPFELSLSGYIVEGRPEDNLIYKCWKLISADYSVPDIKVHLHKNIPMGAGIGGGSSDAAFFINLLNKKFELKLSETEKHRIASELGSDCGFFLENIPKFATGRGNEFSDVKIDLSSFYILLVHPNIHSNTKDAFGGLIPAIPIRNLKDDIENSPIEIWKDRVFNDFDATIFKKYPLIKELKEQLYASGAVYTSMSGSGSCVYGIFKNRPALNFDPSFKYYLQIPTH
ncbi:MAG: 4-(cytidine 5-diphospho)-2-C-methyl-D-erythritol kinase [Bacteroidetes bacterium]|jgi:4-diphosphocytidyl-2-C-methyl-D-erythritol kinase|nr:4-(cytidine 5-diphospho)-2-C-methyl-D-erythritol kinase [Bacteroidota bacterium]